MKKWIWIGSFAILIVLLPVLLSVPPGKWLIERIASKKLQGSVRIETLRLSWFGPQKASGVALKSEELDGQIEELSSRLSFWKLRELKHHFALKNGAFQVHRAGEPVGAVEQIVANVDAPRIEASGVTREGGEVGAFSVQATAQEAVEIEASVSRMPSVLLDRFLKGQGKFAALLGPSFDAKGAAKIQGDSGTLDVNLTAPNATLSLKSEFQGGILTLSEPLVATLQLTPASSQALLGHVVQSQDPIRLQIQPDGFAMPRSGATTIAHGSIDLGRLRVQNVTRTSPIFSLLKRNSSSSSMTAWFTAMDFSLQKNTLKMGRLDALLDGSIHLCAWGDINLTSHRLDLVVGIPADTLTNALGIKGLPADYVLKIPVQGTLEKPDAITGPAAAKIAALLTAQGALQQTPFGAVLGIFNAATNDSSDVPPPKRPFPWE